MVCFLYNILFYCFLRNHLVNMHFTRLIYLVRICLGLAGPLQDSNHYHSRYVYQHQQGLSQHHQFELRENQIHSCYINSWVWDTFSYGTNIWTYNLSLKSKHIKRVYNQPTLKHIWMITHFMYLHQNINETKKVSNRQICMCFWTCNKIFIEYTLSFW